MTNAIEVKQLHKQFDYYRKEEGLLGSVKNVFFRRKLFIDAVKKINFRIRPGEFVGFIGPNGAGKTTTLKMLSGILHPSGGEARVLGFVPWERKEEYLKQISLVMGNKQQLWWDLPAIDSFLLNQKIYGLSDKKFRNSLNILSKMLDIKGLLDIQVRKLSLGQRMKAELALALLHEPKVLFLDEPTIGLDVISQKNVRVFLRQYNREQNTTIILTSHYMDDIKELTDRVITIDHGEIIYDGDLDKLIRQYVREKVLKVFFQRTVTEAELARLGRVILLKDDYAEIVVPREAATAILQKLLSTFPVDDLLVDEVEIEEVVRLIFEGSRPS